MARRWTGKHRRVPPADVLLRLRQEPAEEEEEEGDDKEDDDDDDQDAEGYSE